MSERTLPFARCFLACVIATGAVMTGCTADEESDNSSGDQPTSEENTEPPTVSFESRSTDVSESVGTHRVSATLSKPTEQSASIGLSVSGTARQGDDFQLPAKKEISFESGEQTASLELTVKADDIPEGGETVTFAMTDPSNLELPEGTRNDEAIITHSVIIMGDNALNDTGLETFSDGTDADLSLEPATHPRQDASFGRDAQAEPDDDGSAGFSFTKLDSDGNPLAANAPSWSCTRDNVTGLVWENKSADTSLAGVGTDNPPVISGREFRSGNFVYGWRKKDDSKDTGGSLGIVETTENRLDNREPVSNNCGYQEDGGRRFGLYCNTRAYLQEMNSRGVCGFKDWRLPEASELRSIANHGDSRTSSLPDTAFFSNIKASKRYFTDTPAAENDASAWCFDFAAGEMQLCQKGTYRGVIGVRSSE